MFKFTVFQLIFIIGLSISYTLAHISINFSSDLGSKPSERKSDILQRNAFTASFQSVKAVIEPLEPVGLRVSIPDYDGITSVSFSFKFRNMPNAVTKRGNVQRENGRWVYLDRTTRFKVGSIITCKIIVSFYNSPDHVISQEHVVKEFYSIDGNNNQGGNGGNSDNSAPDSSWNSKIIIQPLKPSGVRIALPNVKGISFVRFNLKYEGVDSHGNTKGTVQLVNDFWIYLEQVTDFRVGSIINCTIQIIYQGHEYAITQNHNVSEFYTLSSPIEPNGNDIDFNDKDVWETDGSDEKTVEVPTWHSEALIEPLKPAGLRIAIPHQEGITRVTFDLKYTGVDPNSKPGNNVKLVNGYWIYLDDTTIFRVGSIIYSTIKILYKGSEYIVSQEHTVSKFYIIQGQGESNGSGNSENNNQGQGNNNNGGGDNGNNKPNTGENNGTGQACSIPSVTKVYQSSGSTRHPCSGELIFEDNFSDTAKFSNQWTVLEQFSELPDYEFVVYRNSYTNFNFGDGLVITPKLAKDEFSDDYVRSEWTLPKCTQPAESQLCHRKGQGWNVLPPVTSARVNTKNFFNFEYGRIEVTAKLPHGNWIYPLIMLEPVHKDENKQLQNVQIRVASSSGNADLKLADNRDYSGRLLWGGITGLSTETFLDHINENITSTSNYDLWSNGYHTYEMTWNRNQMIFKVDGDVYGRIPNYAPADTPFYVTLGVAAGGVSEFPDKCTSNGVAKPWRNIEAKALYKFYKNTDTWSQTWTASSTSLDVKSVKIWAL